MKLQIALDFVTIESALEIVKKVGESVDIIEAGTPFIIENGLRAVTEIKNAAPQKEVLADLKIMDAGEHETAAAVSAGADIVSVLAAADNATISACVMQAHKYGKKILTDMIGISELEKRAIEIEALGVDYICVHTAFDVQKSGKNPLSDLLRVQGVLKKAKAAVAGGVNLRVLPEIIKAKPEIVIVGGGITGQADMGKTAAEMKEIIICKGGK